MELPLPTMFQECDPLYPTVAASAWVIFRSTESDQMSAHGDLSSGLIPPIGKLPPTRPPFESRPPGNVGNVNPNGGLLLFPRPKIGGVAVPAEKDARMSPGGLPRNSSCTLAEVSQLA